jgi:toxin ParE1/3/4
LNPPAIWSTEAERDLEEIAYYIGVHDARPVTAERLAREVHELCHLVATQPMMGERRPEFGANCRVVSFKRRWAVIYRPSVKGIQVVRIVDGIRDFSKLF